MSSLTKSEKIKKLQAQKPSLVRDINLAKLKGTSKTASKSTISKSAYSKMKTNWK
jgi:hypothetical protein